VTLARPAIDPELQGLLAALPTMPQLSPEVVEQVRRFPQPPIETVLDGRDVDRSEITVTSSDGAQIPLSIYAARIWAAGGQAELHVWAGGFHGFDALFPQVRVSAAAHRTRDDGSPGF